MKPLRTLVLFAAVGGLGLLGCGTPVTTDWARAPQLSADERGAPVHPDVAVVWAGPDGRVLGRTFPGFEPETLPAQPIRELVGGERSSATGLAVQFCGDKHFVAYDTTNGVRGRFFSLDLTRALTPPLALGASRARLIRMAWYEDGGLLAIVWKDQVYDEAMAALVDAGTQRVVQTEASLLDIDVRDIDVAASRGRDVAAPFMVSFSAGPRMGALSVQVALVGVLGGTLVAGTFQTVSPAPAWYSDVAIDYHTPSTGYYTLYVNHISTSMRDPGTGDNLIRGALIDGTGAPVARHELAERTFWRTRYDPSVSFVYRDDRFYDLDMAINPNGVIHAVYTQADRTLTTVPDPPNLHAYTFSLRTVRPEVTWLRRPAPLDEPMHTDGRSMFRPRVVWSFDALSAYEEGPLGGAEADWSAHVTPSR